MEAVLFAQPHFSFRQLSLHGYTIQKHIFNVISTTNITPLYPIVEET